jgi:hypothetical protein
MDADPVGRYRVEDAHPTDLVGEASGELTYLLKDRRGGSRRAKLPELLHGMIQAGSDVRFRR